MKGTLLDFEFDGVMCKTRYKFGRGGKMPKQGAHPTYTGSVQKKPKQGYKKKDKT